jgi:Ca2+:H+ antiporter
MALSKGLTEVVKAALTGSIIGNILLALGTSILVGGMRYPHQRYNQTGTRVAATSLALAVIGLVIPTIFQEAISRRGAPWNPRLEHNLSLVIAVILFATYILRLLFSRFTHRRLFAEETSASPDADASETWPLRRSVVVLAVSTLFIAAMSEFLAASVESACRSLGLTEMFVGVIIVAIVGNAGEHSTAIHVALKNKMDLCFGIANGSSVQIALLITPVLVFASHMLGHPMTLQFSLPEIAAIALAVGLIVLISGDGECNWVEGAQLLAVYLIMATLFFFLPASVTPDAPTISPPAVTPATR